MLRRLGLAFVGALPLLALPGPARAADPIMPLSEVRPGMRCTGLTVVRGTAISRFDVEVIDVVTGDPGQSGPRILVRVSGPAVDASGIAEGFSGSPILCRDGLGVERNAGAISETVGEFGDKVGLATPIQEVLGERADPPAGVRSAPALLRRSRPLATPLTVAGLSRPVQRMLATAARRARRRVLAAPAAALASFPPQELGPGASVAAGFSSGDLVLGRVGTVTYRDGDRVWGFGHPLDGAGRRALLLQDAYVFTVINNPLGTEEAASFKVAAPGHTLGTVTNDAVASVVGRAGAAPPTIGLQVSGRDRDTGRSFFSRSEVVDERDADLGTGLPLVGTLAMGQAATSLLRSTPPRVTSSLCLRITVSQRPRRFGFCNDYFDGQAPFDDFGRAIELVEGYEFGPLQIAKVTARLRFRRGVREAFMLKGRAPPRVRPGQVARVRLLLQRRRDGRQRLSFKLRVPRWLAPGRRILTLRGQRPRPLSEGIEEELAALLGEEDADRPGSEEGASRLRSVRELAEAVASIKTVNGVRGTFGRSGRGPVVLKTGSLLVRGKIQVPLRVVGRRRRGRSLRDGGSRRRSLPPIIVALT